MEWVAIDVNIAGDPGVHRMAAALRVRVPELVGLLALTFAGMAQHATDGQLADVPDSVLEMWSRWHGKRGAFAKQFRAELCDESGLVTAWEKYNGAKIRRAEAASARTKAWREKQERERAEREQSAQQNGDVTHNGTYNVRRTRHDKTRPNQDLTTGGAAAPTPPDAPPPVSDKLERFPKAVCDAGYEAFIARIGAVDYSRYRKALTPIFRAASSTPPTAAELVAATEAFAEAREADQPRFRHTYTVERFAGGLREYVRLGQMPLLDQWGDATERGRVAGLGAST